MTFNCTGVTGSGYVVETSPTALTDCWAVNGVVERLPGCAEGEHFYCKGDASRINEPFTENRVPAVFVSEAGKPRANKFSFLIIVLAFLGIANGFVVAQRDNKSAQISDELKEHLINSKVGDVLVDGFQGFTKLDLPLNSDTETRRDCARISYLQTNVDRTGTYWGPPHQLGGCQRCENATDKCHTTYTVSDTQTWIISFAFNAAGAEAAQKAINGNPSTSALHGHRVKPGHTVQPVISIRAIMPRFQSPIR